jgi:hypothetical protein
MSPIGPWQRMTVIRPLTVFAQKEAISASANWVYVIILPRV